MYVVQTLYACCSGFVCLLFGLYMPVVRALFACCPGFVCLLLGLCMYVQTKLWALQMINNHKNGKLFGHFVRTLLYYYYLCSQKDKF